MTAAIFTSNLKKSYGQKEVLKGITLTVDPGTICALLGTNGAGKTTMVRILTTQIVPDAGQAAIMGHDVVRDADHIHQVIGLTRRTCSSSLRSATFPARQKRLMRCLRGWAWRKQAAVWSRHIPAA